jgi:hypothetical protein
MIIYGTIPNKEERTKMIIFKDLWKFVAGKQKKKFKFKKNLKKK